MEEQKVVLSQEDLNKVIQYRQDYEKQIFDLGEQAVKIEMLKKDLEVAQKEQSDSLEFVKKLKEEETRLASEIFQKYNKQGIINIDTGEIL